MFFNLPQITKMKRSRNGVLYNVVEYCHYLYDIHQFELPVGLFTGFS